MSPLAPSQKWFLRAGIVVALVVTLPLLGLRGVAHADLGDEPSKSTTADQADDADKPKDGSLLEKKPADAAVAQKQQAPVTPFYEKWQFWALAGGILVVGTLLVVGAFAIGNNLGGGDVRPCNPAFLGCGGEGR
jgi:hypothetical protein